MYQEGKIMQYWRSQLKTFTCTGWLWIFLSGSLTLKILFQLRTTLLTSTRYFSYLQIEKYRSQIFWT